ncbi:hypothetical protein DESC_940099 [Desulfosarcina cetonica]|nr:hypothetical protein DESC_940099 [Desulfosarcina cetonica]
MTARRSNATDGMRQNPVVAAVLNTLTPDTPDRRANPQAKGDLNVE